jgi:uroporphyrinogen decarboxylase
VDTRTVLNRGSPAEVRRQVLKRLEVFSRGGGFVFNPVHNILPDVPPQNILAMFGALAEFHGGGGWRDSAADGIMAGQT